MKNDKRPPPPLKEFLKEVEDMVKKIVKQEQTKSHER